MLRKVCIFATGFLGGRQGIKKTEEHGNGKEERVQTGGCGVAADDGLHARLAGLGTGVRGEGTRPTGDLCTAPGGCEGCAADGDGGGHDGEAAAGYCHISDETELL